MDCYLYSTTTDCGTGRKQMQQKLHECTHPVTNKTEQTNNRNIRFIKNSALKSNI